MSASLEQLIGEVVTDPANLDTATKLATTVEQLRQDHLQKDPEHSRLFQQHLSDLLVQAEMFYLESEKLGQQAQDKISIDKRGAALFYGLVILYCTKGEGSAEKGQIGDDLLNITDRFLDRFPDCPQMVMIDLLLGASFNDRSHE
jgi:hypothetical protein